MEPIGANRKNFKNRCSNLRWKGLYIDAQFDAEHHFSNDSALTCLQTFKRVGPDGVVVDEFECSPSRKCYEPL